MYLWSVVWFIWFCGFFSMCSVLCFGVCFSLFEVGFFFCGVLVFCVFVFFFNWLAQLLLLTNLGAACIVKVDN